MAFKTTLTTAALVILAAANPGQVQAVTTPTFPVCSNPQGTLKVSYNDGTHGIVGNTGTYTGSDAVYTLSSDTLMQCFCADDGNGIQTNWWRISSLSDADIQTLKNQGWYYVPNGALWGLDPVAYMTKNETYACKSGSGGGDILATSTNVPSILGLATTGNSATLYGLAALAALAFVTSFALRKRE